MMKLRHPENGAGLGRFIAAWSRSLHHTSRTLSHQLLKELQRLNSARMGSGELSLLAPSERVRAVKAALMRHHEGKPRCC